MKLESGDYFIARHRGRAKLCVKLAGGFRATLESTLHADEPETIEYDPEQVLCNLGQNPKPDTYCKVKVRPFIKTVESKRFGPIHICTEIPKKDMKALSGAMKTVFDWYEKNVTTAFLPLYAIYLYPPAGKMVGCYITKVKGTDIQDEMHLMPKAFSDTKYNEYMIAHEFAHGLFNRCVPKPIRAKWLKLYQKRLKLSKIKREQLDLLWKSVVEYEGGLSAFQKEMADDTDSLVLKEVIGYFRRNHRMTRDDIDMMLLQDTETLADMWPSTTALTEERPDISTYSLKSYQEFFCEAVAYHATGKKLPKDVEKGLQYTFKHCKRTLNDN